MQRSHRQARSAPPSNVDRAAQISRVSWASLLQRGYANAATHKVYTALALSLLLSSFVSAVHPKAGVRMLAVNTSFALGGAWLAACIGNARIQGLQLDKDKMLAETNRIKAGQDRRETEIAERQRSLATAQTELEAARIHLKTAEDGYKIKADAAATKAAQHEANKRVAEAERVARRQVAEAEKRLGLAIKDAEATVQRMQVELAQGLKAARAEAASQVLAVQTDSDRAIALAAEQVAAAEAICSKSPGRQPNCD